jgi:hypothetical protein
VLACDWVILGGGGLETKLRISPRVFALLGGESVEGLALERRETSPSR